MTEHHINVNRTARYFTLSEPSPEVRYCWIVFHGMGQLAERFIKRFEGLEQPTHFVVAPEGLSRYYVDAAAMRVGASWMTKEDRLAEIEDQRTYLNALYDQLRKQLPRDCQYIGLGFSQGVATLSRWLAQDYLDLDLDHTILWAGTPPEDTPFWQAPSFQKPVWMVYGEQDPIVTPAKMKKKVEWMESEGVEVKTLAFEGRHEVTSSALVKLTNSIIEK